MSKSQNKKFPYGKVYVFGKDVPLTKSGGLDMRVLNKEEKKIYLEFIEKTKPKEDHGPITFFEIEKHIIKNLKSSIQ